MTDADRTAAERRFREEFGCGEADARLAARARFPFDDDTPPGDGLAEDITTRVRHFERDSAGLRGNQLGVAARRAIEEYLQLARDHHDMHHVGVFESLLDQTRGPVGAPEPSE